MIVTCQIQVPGQDLPVLATIGEDLQWFSENQDVQTYLQTLTIPLAGMPWLPSRVAEVVERVHAVEPGLQLVNVDSTVKPLHDGRVY